jgi:NitT/TauT family transport system ATP-binding protein
MQGDLLRLWEQKKKTVVFVTHAMEEAVYLSDRVMLMTPRPGEVKEIIDVPLPRPRADEIEKERDFVELKEYLWVTLKEMQTIAPAG